VTVPGVLASQATGIDVLNGLEQELTTETKNAALIIHNLLVKDYPILTKLVAASQ
jgi:hypothetical protein